ncbi:BspA family leucine-rich repeat surface protein, partial [Escherichia coli]|nr:BspA family leucine-rich repeat surface protein [Escherichia coli]
TNNNSSESISLGSGAAGSSSASSSTTSQQKEFKIKVADKTEIKLELGKITSGTVPTKYIDKNGKEVTTDS